MDWEYDLIIVGGGITGLKIARDLSQKNQNQQQQQQSSSFLRILVIESASCLGGHVPVPEPALAPPASALDANPTPTANTTSRSVLPAVRPGLYSHSFSKIFSKRHDLLVEEAQRYHLPLSSVDISPKLYIQSGVWTDNTDQRAASRGRGGLAGARKRASAFRVGFGEVLPWKDYWPVLQHRPAYQQVIHHINQDASRIDPSKGIYQEGLDSLDLSWEDYLYDQVIIEEEDTLVLEFFLFLPFILLGGYSEEVSALMVLHLIASIRIGGTIANRGVGVEGAIAFLTSYDILGDGGMIDLVSALAQDCYQSKHVDFLMESTVIDINYTQQPRPAVHTTTIPHYDYPLDPRPLAQATVRLANGRTITSKCVVLTVPLNALLSIRFSGSSSGWPDAWQRAAMRCNHSRQYMEVYANSRHVSKKINHLYSLNMENRIQESEIIIRRPAVLKEEEEDSRIGGIKKSTLVRVAGRRNDLLADDLSSVLQMVYPSIECQPQQPQPSRDCWYRDDIGNPRLRGARFIVKPGTTRLLQEASQECLSLWQRTWSVYWASSELSPVWPGWVEGCLRAGQTAVDLLTPHLLPVPIPRNFARLAVSTTRHK